MKQCRYGGTEMTGGSVSAVAELRVQAGRHGDAASEIHSTPSSTPPSSTTPASTRKSCTAPSTTPPAPAKPSPARAKPSWASPSRQASAAPRRHRSSSSELRFRHPSANGSCHVRSVHPAQSNAAWMAPVGNDSHSVGLEKKHATRRGSGSASMSTMASCITRARSPVSAHASVKHRVSTSPRPINAGCVGCWTHACKPWDGDPQAPAFPSRPPGRSAHADTGDVAAKRSCPVGRTGASAAADASLGGATVAGVQPSTATSPSHRRPRTRTSRGYPLSSEPGAKHFRPGGWRSPSAWSCVARR